MGDQPARRQTLGIVLRGFLSALEKRGLREPVRKAVSPEVAKLMDQPPIHMAWIDSRVLDEMLIATLKLSDRTTIRDLGHEVVRSTSGPIIAPLLKTFLTLFGTTPASLFSNLNAVARLQFTGLTFQYLKSTDRSGMVEVRYIEKVNPVVFTSWEGTLMFAFDVCGVRGIVSRAELQEDGCSAKLAVQW